MKLVWSPEELVEHWSIEPEDRANIPDTVGEFGCLGLPRSPLQQLAQYVA